MARTDRLADKVVFITGAASGIGRVSALAFAAEGARVAVLDRSADALEAVPTSLTATDTDVLAIECDVSAPDEVEAAVKRVADRFGRLDIAFNNAGVENKAARTHELSLANGTGFSTSTFVARSSA